MWTKSTQREPAMLADLPGALGLLLLFAALLAVTETLARRTALPAEILRKLVHLGGGLGCLLFPLWVSHLPTVLLLALLFGAVFAWGERSRQLRCLCSVTRRSRGSLYYPFAIAALFALTRDQYPLYVSAVLVLTVADTGAALVGSRFGRLRYRAGDVTETKSLEGSLVFGLLTFLAVFLPLTLMDADVSRAQTFYSAWLAATLLTLVEAVAGGGRDNVYVPLLAAFMLLKTVTKSVPELAMQSVSMPVLMLLVALINRYTRMLRAKGGMIMAVFVYGVWSLGSADWAVPLLIAFACFGTVFALTGNDQRPTRVYRRMAVLTAPAATLVLAANLTGEFRWLYGPFMAALCTPLLWGVVLQSAAADSTANWHWSMRQIALALIALAAALAFPLLAGRTPAAGTLAGGAVIVIGVVWGGIGLAARLRRVPGGLVAFLAVCVAILLVGAGQATGLLDLWNPLRWADVYGREADALWPLR
jgi:dolichol kinase